MKGKKIIVPVLLASLVSAPVVSGAHSLVGKASASSDTTKYVEGIGASITGYVPEVAIGNDPSHKNEAKITVPTLSATGATQKITMVSPLGEETVVTGGDTVYVSEKGYYTFKFELTGSNALDTKYEQLVVKVVGDTYTMNMPEHTRHIVPETLDLGENGTEVNFPVPMLYKNGEKVENVTDGKIVLNITDPTGNPITVETITEKDGEKCFTHTFSKDVQGRYRIKYTYVINDSVEATTATKIVKLVKGYNLSDVELDFSLVSSMPTYAEIGKKVNLPEINVFDKSNSSKYLDAYTEITVKYLGNENVPEAEREFTVNNFEFTPKYSGTYFITYKGSIPLWGKSTGERTYRIQDVKDTTAPTLYLTNSYSIAEDGKILTANSEDITSLELEDQLAKLGDLSYNLDAYYEVDSEGKATVAIPAVFATDNSSSLKEIIENEGTKRELYKYGSSSNKLTLVKDITGNTSAKINEVGYYTFSNTPDANGNKWGADENNYYVVLYTLEDSLGNYRTYSYKLYIREYEKLSNDGPSVTIDPNLKGATVKSDGTLTFSKPVVVDKHDGKIYDEKVETHTYYSYISGDLATATDKVELTDKDLNDDGKYEIKIDKTGNPANIYIITEAKNHYATATVAYESVTIKYTENDTKAPNMSVINFNEQLVDVNEGTDSKIVLNAYGQYEKDRKQVGLFNQDAIVKLPEVTFEDNDSSLDLSMVLSYTAPNGNVTKTIEISDFYVSSVKNTESDAVSSNKGYKHTIKNATFTASNAGYYVVTYIAKDSGNNISFKSYAVYVNDTVGPQFKIPNLSKFSEALRPGQTFEVPSAIVMDNGEELDGAEVTIEVTGPGFVTKSSDNKSFVPSKTGSYEVTYTAKDAAGNPSTYKAPVIKVEAVLNEETFHIDYVTTDYETDYTNITYEKDSNGKDTSVMEKIVVLVPKATASDDEMNENIVVGKPVVKDSNGSEKTVSALTSEDGYTADQIAKYYKFTASSQGVHTVSYTATNQFGIEITKSYNIEVGDTAAPELRWHNKAENLPTTVNVGSSWNFSYDFVTITDEDSNDVLNDGITADLKMTDPDGNVTKDATNYTFDKVGSYTFTITLKDKAGNSTKNNYQYTINVEEKETEPTEVNNTTGTILIVTSVVVLGGVVVYFVLSGRKANAKSKKKSAKKENKN